MSKISSTSKHLTRALSKLSEAVEIIRKAENTATLQAEVKTTAKAKAPRTGKKKVAEKKNGRPKKPKTFLHSKTRTPRAKKSDKKVDKKAA